jgi:20S proteasome alpha/beta subunit
VSIVSALVCKDTILIAGDSRMTDDPGIRDDAKKINRVELKDATVLVAQSGNVDSSNSVMDLLRKAIEGRDLKDYGMIGDAATSALVNVKRTIAKNVLGCAFNKAREAIFREGRNCNLLICHYFEGKPVLYFGDLAEGVANKKDGFPYWSIGIGRELANYLLGQFKISEMDRMMALATAVYVIHEVKGSITGCGGGVQASAINSANRSVELSKIGLQGTETRISQMINDHKRDWLVKIERILKRGVQEYPGENMYGLEMYR